MMVMSTICSTGHPEFGSKLYRSRLGDGAVKGSPRRPGPGGLQPSARARAHELPGQPLRGRPDTARRPPPTGGRLVAAAAAGAAGPVRGWHRVRRDLVLRLEGAAAAA